MEISLIYFFGEEIDPLLDYPRVTIVKFEGTVRWSFLETDTKRQAWNFAFGPLFTKHFELEIEVDGAEIADLFALLVLLR